MPVEWVALAVVLAAAPREASPGDTELPLELLEFLADMDKAPAWLREAPAAPELDDPPASAPAPSTGRNQAKPR